MPKITVTEEQWLERGIRRFAEGGSDGLVIEQMSAELGCSKSSFYWYFKNRNEFMARIVNRWSGMATDEVMRSSSQHERAGDRLASMLLHMFSVTQQGDFLFHLRKLQRTLPDFHGILDRIEQARMDYARLLLVENGLAFEAAELKSQFLYHYYLGWYERHKHDQLGSDEVQRHVRQVQHFLLRAEVGEGEGGKVR